MGDFGTILKTTNGGIYFVNEAVPPKSNFTVYPNPAVRTITINNEKNMFQETRITLFTYTGVLVLRSNFNNQPKITMDVSGLKEGLYLLKIEADGSIETKKLMIQ